MSNTADSRLKEVVSRRIEFFRKKPEAATYKPRVSSKHVRGLYTESIAREHTVRSDYGEAAGGTNLAPNPIELLLSAMASCIEAAFYEFAVHEGLTISSLTVEVEGTLDLRGLFMIDNIPAGFSDIQYTMNIGTPDDIEKARALAEKIIAHCPVVDSLIRPVSVSGDINIRDLAGH